MRRSARLSLNGVIPQGLEAGQLLSGRWGGMLYEAWLTPGKDSWNFLPSTIPAGQDFVLVKAKHDSQPVFIVSPKGDYTFPGTDGGVVSREVQVSDAEDRQRRLHIIHSSI